MNTGEMLITDEMLTRAAFEVDAAILAMLPDETECDHVFSPAFHAKMKRLIWRAKHLTAYTALKRVACVFIAFLVSASIFLAASPTARAAVVDWVQERFNEFYHYFFVGELPSAEVDGAFDGNSLEEAVDFRDYYLSWVPDGYVESSSFESDNLMMVIYENESNEIIQFSCIPETKTHVVFTGVGDYEQEFIVQNGITMEVLLALNPVDSNVITWTNYDDNARFTIAAFVDKAALVKMAQNVAFQKNN